MKVVDVTFVFSIRHNVQGGGYPTIIADFTEKIKIHLALGWVLNGSITVDNNDSILVMIQQMVKYGNDDEPNNMSLSDN